MRFPAFTLGVVLSAPLLALDIEGVQMASMDQPRVTVTLRRSADGEPLFAKGDPGMAQLLGLDKEAADKVTAFAAFLDTGASGISISTQTADSLGIKRLRRNPQQQSAFVLFHDVGVGGADQFNVSEPLHLSLGAYQALGVTGSTSTTPAGGPWHCQIGPLNGGGLLGMLVGGIDVVGMPVMAGRIVELDVRPVNSFSDTIRVHFVDPQAARPNMAPEPNRRVLLSYADFTPFTRIEPAGAARPVTIANPFIGPSPIPLPGTVPPRPIVLRHNGRQTTGSWLLDTGAAASMISKSSAEKLGIRYKPGSDTQLEGVPQNKQFTLTIGGIGGQKKAGGFFIDELRVPTLDGDDLIYKPAPVLVADITVQHPETGKTLTLDGVFGMNFLVASAQVTEGLAPDLGKMTEGPYDWVIIDHTKGLLGLVLRRDLAR